MTGDILLVGVLVDVQACLILRIAYHGVDYNFYCVCCPR
jgi:hypothetical protein